MHTHTYICTHTHQTHTYTRIHTQTHTHTPPHTRTHTPTHTQHTYSYTRTHTHTHTHTHIHMRVASPQGEALLCDPQGGFWPDVHILPWDSYLFYIISDSTAQRGARSCDAESGLVSCCRACTILQVWGGERHSSTRGGSFININRGVLSNIEWVCVW